MVFDQSRQQEGLQKQQLDGSKGLLKAQCSRGEQVSRRVVSTRKEWRTKNEQNVLLNLDDISGEELDRSFVNDGGIYLCKSSQLAREPQQRHAERRRQGHLSTRLYAWGPQAHDLCEKDKRGHRSQTGWRWAQLMELHAKGHTSLSPP